MMETIKLSTGPKENPGSIEIRAEVSDGLAVHRSVSNQMILGEERWVVTHVGSGLCVAKGAGDIEQATVVMNLLTEEGLGIDWSVDYKTLREKVFADAELLERIKALIVGQQMKPGEGK